jgi:hypothetical protein
MEKTAYFQRYLNVRSMAEIKIANSARRPSMPLLKPLPRPDTSLKTIHLTCREPKEGRTEREGRGDKENRENLPKKEAIRFPLRLEKRRTRLCNIDLH